jgi:hypothetical protein
MKDKFGIIQQQIFLKKQLLTTAGTWASATSMNTARHGLAGAGIQTAALAFGGFSTSLQQQQKNMTDQLGHQSY